MQNAKLNSVARYGRLSEEEGGGIISGPCFPFPGGPFTTLAEYYRALAIHRLKAADSSPVINSWQANGLRARIANFPNEGLEKLCAAIETNDISSLAFVHGDISKQLSLYGLAIMACRDEMLASSHTALDNINVRLDIPNGICKITSTFDCDFSRIAHPLEEFMSSFYDLHAFLPGRHSKSEQNALMHTSLLEGFQDPLPRSIASAVDEEQHSHSSDRGISWVYQRRTWNSWNW